MTYTVSHPTKTQSQLQTKTPEACTCKRCHFFKDYHEPNGRGWCLLFDKPARSNHALTKDCLSSLPPETEFCKYSESDKVKLIDDKKHHSEWETFVVVGKKQNKNAFKTPKAYLTEPEWYILIATTDRLFNELKWVAETEICHANQSEFIETAEVF